MLHTTSPDHWRLCRKNSLIRYFYTWTATNYWLMRDCDHRRVMNMQQSRTLWAQDRRNGSQTTKGGFLWETERLKLASGFCFREIFRAKQLETRKSALNTIRHGIVELVALFWLKIVKSRVFARRLYKNWVACTDRPGDTRLLPITGEPDGKFWLRKSCANTDIWLAAAAHAEDSKQAWGRDRHEVHQEEALCRSTQQAKMFSREFVFLENLLKWINFR